MSQTSKIEVITPQIAEEMLKGNTNNRPLRPGYLDALAESIRSGRWVTDGQTIVISRNGVLIDGQHRLHAVIRAGTAISTWVVRGVEDGSFITMDTGIPRADSDVLSLSGEMNTARLAATLLCVSKYYTGFKMRTAYRDPGKVLRLLSTYPGVRNSLNIPRVPKGFCPPSVLSAAHYLFSQVSASHADQFIGQVIRGNDLTCGSAVHRIHSRLTQERSTIRKTPPEVLFALIIKSWNSWFTGKPMRNLSFRSGDRAEPFPRVEGLGS